uniref:CUB domain-containing protein n=1 Tax=Setaria digitata TaxID=48799 RepID=A0A915PYR7_9BILA
MGTLFRYDTYSSLLGTENMHVMKANMAFFGFQRHQASTNQKCWLNTSIYAPSFVTCQFALTPKLHLVQQFWNSGQLSTHSPIIKSSSPTVVSKLVPVPFSSSSSTLLSLSESPMLLALFRIILFIWIDRRTFLLLISCYVLIAPSYAVLSYEPQISYFDGAGYLDNCKSKLERRVTALSGLLISHQLYGSIPYNASKNCFLLITAPSGYRIRLRVLDFNVLGDAHNCDKDTLHVFDHEKPIDPQALRDANQEDTSPGPILGQFCGTIRNASELAVSTENALTLWWHTDAELPFHHNGEGFRLLWSAFRKSNVAPCNAQREFTCNNQECIAAELACNRYPDCKDESDLIRELQIAHKCDFLTDDPLGSLTGLTLLLISMAAVSLSACLCICACICCKCMKTPDKACTTATATELAVERTPCYSGTDTAALQQPTPPGFYPPSPPTVPPPVGKKISQKAAMNSAVAGRDLINPIHHRGGSFISKQGVPLLVAPANEYGSTPIQKNNSHSLTSVPHLNSKNPNVIEL